MTKLIVNVQTGEEITRELNKAELAQQEADNELSLEANKSLADSAALKEAALTRLGLTAEEIKLFL